MKSCDNRLLLPTAGFTPYRYLLQNHNRCRDEQRCVDHLVEQSVTRFIDDWVLLFFQCCFESVITIYAPITLAACSAFQ